MMSLSCWPVAQCPRDSGQMTEPSLVLSGQCVDTENFALIDFAHCFSLIYFCALQIDMLGFR